MKLYKPETLKEAMELRRTTAGAVFRAGGTHLLARLRARTSRTPRPTAIIALDNIARLKGVEVGAEVIRLGAMTPLGELLRSRELAACCPALIHAAAGAGPPRLRDRATLGGDLCEAAPGCHTAPALMVYDAWVELADRRGRREVGLEYFFIAPGETGRTPGEVLTTICFRRPSVDDGSGTAMAAGSLGRVSAAARLSFSGRRLEEVRLAASHVASTPVRLEQAEELLVGAEPTAALVRDAGRLSARCAAPVGLSRAAAAYRRRALGDLVTALLTSLISRREG